MILLNIYGIKIDMNFSFLKNYLLKVKIKKNY